MPGSYWLAAAAQPKSDAPLSPEQLANIRTRNDVFQQMYAPNSSAQISIDMSSSDIDGVVLTLKRGSPVPVHVSVENAESVIAERSGRYPGHFGAEVSGIYRQSGRLDATATVASTTYRRHDTALGSAFPLSANVYLKELLYGRADAIKTPFEITDEAPSTIPYC
jgi:hypothetical protein